jgi:hypothetical protein
MSRWSYCLLLSVLLHLLCAWQFLSYSRMRSLTLVDASTFPLGIAPISLYLKEDNGQGRQSVDPAVTTFQKQVTPSSQPDRKLAQHRVAIGEPRGVDELHASTRQRTYYFAPEQLQSHPTPLSDFDFDVSCVSSNKVKFKVWISEHGVVDNVQIVHDKVAFVDQDCLDRIAQSIANVRFTPGQRNAAPVASLWYIEVWRDALAPDMARPPRITSAETVPAG